MLSELTEEDVRYIHIYIHFILNYIPIFIPCLLGSLAIDKVRKYRGENPTPASKKLILLSTAIVTFIVMLIDLLGVTEHLRNEGLSIVIGFIGGILSRSIITAILNNSFVSTMCKEFIDKNTGGSLISSFASALDKETQKETQVENTSVKEESKEKKE